MSVNTEVVEVVEKRRRGRPIGSGIGNYTKTAKCGRPKKYITEEELQIFAEKKRKWSLEHYHKKQAIKVAQRKQRQIKIDRINIILNKIEKYLKDNDELIERFERCFFI